MLVLKHFHSRGKLAELCINIRHMFQSLIGRTLESLSHSEGLARAPSTFVILLSLIC